MSRVNDSSIYIPFNDQRAMGHMVDLFKRLQPAVEHRVGMSVNSRQSTVNRSSDLLSSQIVDRIRSYFKMQSVWPSALPAGLVVGQGERREERLLTGIVQSTLTIDDYIIIVVSSRFCTFVTMIEYGIELATID